MNSFENLSINNEKEKSPEMEQEDSLEFLSDQVALETSIMKDSLKKPLKKKLATFLIGLSLLAYQDVYPLDVETKSNNFTTSFTFNDNKKRNINNGHDDEKEDENNEDYINEAIRARASFKRDENINTKGRIKWEIEKGHKKRVSEEVKKILNDETYKNELEKAMAYSLVKYEKWLKGNKEGGFDFENFYEKRGELKETKEKYINDGIYEYVNNKNDRAKKMTLLLESIDLIF